MQDRDGLFAKRGTSGLASFAQALHVRAGPQHDVFASQANDLRRAQPGLHGQQQQGAVTPTALDTEIGRCKQSVCLDGREEADGSAHVAFARHSKNALRHGAVFWRVQCDVAEE